MTATISHLTNVLWWRVKRRWNVTRGYAASWNNYRGSCRRFSEVPATDAVADGKAPALPAPEDLPRLDLHGLLARDPAVGLQPVLKHDFRAGEQTTKIKWRGDAGDPSVSPPRQLLRLSRF